MITVNGNLTELKNAYRRETKEKDKRNVRVVLTYRTPTTLLYGKYRSDEKTALVHEVNALFFLGKDGYANCMWDEGIEADQALYSAGRMKSRGYKLPLYDLATVEIKEIDAKDYRNAWQAIAKSMRRYGINLKTADCIEAGVQGETQCESEYCKKEKLSPFHTHFCQNYWDMKKDKPVTMDFADILRDEVNPKVETPEGGIPWKEYKKRERQIVNEQVLDAMKRRMNKTESGDMHYRVNRNGTKRDRSVDLQVHKDGTTSYTSASEYAGCGNGSYYIMYSPTKAVYCEDD